MHINMHGSHLNHVTTIMLFHFFSFYLNAYIQNLAENGPVSSEKKQGLFFICELHWAKVKK